MDNSLTIKGKDLQVMA